MLRRTSLLAAAGLALATGATPAQAAQLVVDDAASPAETLCTSIAPCTLDNAVGDAQPGDTVIVRAGTYAIGAPLSVSGAIEIRGEDPAAPPVLDGASNLNAATLTADGGVRLTSLTITADGNLQDALTMRGGAHGDRLTLTSQTGDGAKLISAPGATKLTNSLVKSGGGSGYAALKLRDNGPEVGTIEVRNVTAYATGPGVRCETTVATSAIVNSIVRGDTADVDASTAGSKCSATNSNLRTASSPGLSVTAVQTAAPSLDGQYRPLAGSNTIDAGVDAAANGTLDLAGAPRVQGARTDAGAYEFASPAADTRSETPQQTTAAAPPTATPPAIAPESPAPAAPLAPAAPPQLGKTVLLDQAGTGAVFVKLPGTGRFVPLADAASLPVGTTIDTRKGAVTLSSALAGGKSQTGTFSGGLFQVKQDPKGRGMTDILLTGGRFAGCPSGRRARTKPVARAAARRSKPVRRLWAKDKGGRFRTHGKNSVATVRGTRWLTEDRCEGTFTKVTAGAVDVRDKRTGRVRRVKAGRSLLVRR
jgi:hypothetical protein